MTYSKEEEALRRSLPTHFSKLKAMQWAHEIRHDQALLQAMYHLIFDAEERIATQAAYIFSNTDRETLQQLAPHTDRLITEAMRTHATGLQRILLSILLRLPLPTEIQPDFLDFCLETALSVRHPHAIRSSCLKLAYAQCRQEPELLSELSATLELMEPSQLPPSLQSARRHIMQDMRKHAEAQPKGLKKSRP